MFVNGKMLESEMESWPRWGSGIYFLLFFSLRKLSSLFKMKNNNQMKGGSLGMISNTLQMGPPGWAGLAAWSSPITAAQLLRSLL